MCAARDIKLTGLPRYARNDRTITVALTCAPSNGGEYKKRASGAFFYYLTHVHMTDACSVSPVRIL